MAEGGKSGRGNAQIPVPTAPKQAAYVKQSEDGTRYGTSPNPQGGKK